MNVLSLFDGKSGAMAALDYLNIKVDNYYACEIDKYAQQVSRYHYPDIIRLGDVTKVTLMGLPKIDLLVAGFPCQAFSFAGKQLNFDDPRGKLFFEVVRLLNELQPRFFLLENVRMKKDIENEINKLVGVKPVLINSALLGAQNRLRNYWCGGYKDGKVCQIEIIQPTDAGIYLKDIIEDGESDREKSHCLDANYSKGANWEQYQAKSRRQLVIVQRSRGFNKGGIFTEKAPTLSSCSWQNNNYLSDGVSYRKITPTECERLQNYPDDYTAQGIDNKGNQVKISNSQRYKMLGNGFDRLTVAHCLKQILES